MIISLSIINQNHIIYNKCSLQTQLKQTEKKLRLNIQGQDPNQWRSKSALGICKKCVPPQNNIGSNSLNLLIFMTRIPLHDYSKAILNYGINAWKLYLTTIIICKHYLGTAAPPKNKTKIKTTLSFRTKDRTRTNLYICSFVSIKSSPLAGQATNLPGPICTCIPYIPRRYATDPN